jgi:hypothetical protein
MASAKATAAGFPFNCHSTFHYQAMNIPADKGQEAVAKLINLARDYLATKGARLYWVCTREDGRDKRGHAHIIWHIPPEHRKAFFARWRSWRALLATKFAHDDAAIGGHEGQRIMKTRCIGGTALAYASNSDAFTHALAYVLGYILKGASPETITALGLLHAHEHGGAITGKRALWWQFGRPSEARGKAISANADRTCQNLVLNDAFAFTVPRLVGGKNFTKVDIC